MGSSLQNEKVLECLQTAFDADRNAMHALVCNRVPCNLNLAQHKNVVVDVDYVIGDGHFQAGMLGVLNGVLEAAGLQKIATQWEDKPDEVDGSKRFVGFQHYVAPDEPV